MDYVDENGQTFEEWVVGRSFRLLIPICKLGFLVLLCFLGIADPLYAGGGMWSKQIAHVHLVTWHAAMALFFGAFAMVAKGCHTYPARLWTLRAFVVGCGMMFAWFGVVSWIGVGDFSIVAIAHLTVAAVFCLPGRLRQIVYILSAAAIGLVTAKLDSSGRFLGEMQFVNLLVIVAVAIAIEQFMRDTNHALFVEKCKVEEERQRADSVLYNAMPVQVADALKYQGEVKAQRHVNMAILFADLEGFTAFAAQVAPDKVLQVLNDVYSEFDTLALAHKVEKVKTIGDAYMVISPDSAAQLADFSLEMVHTLARFNARNALNFGLRIGLHMGPTVSGVVGRQRLAYDVWGDAVNIASRLENTGMPGRVHVSSEIRTHLADSHLFEERGEIALKGKGSVRTYYLSGRKAALALHSKPSASGYTP